MGNAESNELTKEAIYISLIKLMEKQDFDKITITDIAKKAGVSRMAFYRNYESKDDILFNYLDELFEQYYADVSKHHYDFYEFALHFFRYYEENCELVQAIIKANLQIELLKKMNHYQLLIFAMLHDIEIEVPPSKANLAANFFVGGLFNLLTYWIGTGMRESKEEMAKIVIKFGFENNND